MKILVAAKYLTGKAEEGGSSRFFRLVIKTLVSLGHSVVEATEPDKVVGDTYDLILCSHGDILKKLKVNPAPKVCISHGLIGDEHFVFGADRYVSISEEIQADNRLRGIDSEVIGQPIEMRGWLPPGAALKKILIIRRYPLEIPDPFAFLSKRYNVRVSDMSKPIEDQIAWADLVIAVGRGALEAMAQGRPVIVADARTYNLSFVGRMDIGDGYVTPALASEMARNNFSGRRFKIPLTREWIEGEIAKYNADDSEPLRAYVEANHDARKIVARYLEPVTQSNLRFSFGVLINDRVRFDMCLKQSELAGQVHFLENAKSATKGLNKLLDVIEKEGADVAILTHQDMYYRHGWLGQVREQIAKLPENWTVAGIIGKDMEGRICGQFRDMRIPLHFNTMHIHTFPQPACCFDECCLIINMKSGFRFDETLDGWDLYGTLAVLQTWERGGSAWVIDAPAEHYCLRPFTWVPDKAFQRNYKKLYKRYEGLRVDSTVIARFDSTAVGLPKEALRFETSAA